MSNQQLLDTAKTLLQQGLHQSAQTTVSLLLSVHGLPLHVHCEASALFADCLVKQNQHRRSLVK